MHKYPFGSTLEIPGGRPGLLILAYFGPFGWLGWVIGDALRIDPLISTSLSRLLC